MHITIIGSGNVAWHIIKATQQAGHLIDAVASRSMAHAEQIALRFDIKHHTGIGDIPTTSDLYIIAVTDSSIGDVAEKMPVVNGVVVHTSGATPAEVLSRFEKHGVLYPCQTFSKNDDTIDYPTLPFFIEGCSESATKVINEYAHSISTNVSYANSIQRQHLHVSAVLVNNFTNHLFHLAKQHMESNGMSFDMLHPLIKQTVEKAFAATPYEAQTGPARRHDNATISKHEQLIDDKTTLRIYELITQSIQNIY